MIKHETGSFSSYHQELQPCSPVSGVEQEVETQHQYSYAEYEDQEYTRGEGGVRILNTITHLSPGVSLIYDLVHDSGMLQSELLAADSSSSSSNVVVCLLFVVCLFIKLKNAC